MKLLATVIVATSLLASTGALAQGPYKCQRFDSNCQTPLPTAQPLAPQGGYGLGRPYKCQRYDWSCHGAPIAPLGSDFPPHGVRQRLEPFAPTSPAIPQWR